MNSQHPLPKSKKDPGRPRNDRLTDRILDETVNVLGKYGIQEFSLVKVAKAARTTRPALYRRWPNKEALVNEAVTRVFNRTLLEPLTSIDARKNIISILDAAIHLLQTPEYRKMLASIAASAVYMEANSYLLAFLRQRRGILIRQELVCGIKNGQFPSDLDIEFTIDALNGPIFFRSLIMNLEVPDTYARKLVAALLPESPL